MYKNSLIITFISFFIFSSNSVYTQNRWTIDSDRGITWNVKGGDVHSDHIEMSGKQISVVLRYGITKEGTFTINKSLVFPLLRTIPNNTHASLMRRSDWNILDLITVNGYSLTNEKVKRIFLKGMLNIDSDFKTTSGNINIKRTYFPSTELPVLLEKYQMENISEKEMMLELPETNSVITTDPVKGVDGSYIIEMYTDKSGSFVLKPGEVISFFAYTTGRKNNESFMIVDGQREMNNRETLINSWMNNLILESPNEIINTMFAFSKIRALESIYETKNGPMHGPGGESYYSAIWANDQAEYINPYFPFTGYDYGNKSALNSFRLFANYMNDEWKPIPSSIIAEGLDIWNGAGDRGDAAMIAYGAARYALARGSRSDAIELTTLIDWCLEYCRRNLNEFGVVKSDTDELENRFESGEANLCTSSLYYDALISSAYLNQEIGGPSNKSKEYCNQAEKLRKNIENYFGANVEGFETYQYYKGNDILRSWICIPLTVGIKERTEGTLGALFSPRLWTKDGLLTQAGSSTFWDRSTLYALRGAFIAGATEQAISYLDDYSTTRLLGDHVPYAIEAWPEGSQRHLSAESGLYGRIITEGVFGIRPTGLNSFSISPRLPKDWNEMTLRRVMAFNTCFDVEVERIKNNKILVTISIKDKIVLKKSIDDGDLLSIEL